MEVVVLNCWVTETKLTLCADRRLRSFSAKSDQGSGEPIDFVDDNGPDFACLNVTQKLLQGGRSIVPPEKPPSS